MNKIIIFCLSIGISLLLVSPIKAQEGDTKRGGFQIKGGPAFSTIGFNNEEASEHKNRFRVGGIFGVGYEARTKSFLAFEIEALYDLRGTKEEATLIGGNEIVNKNYLHYVQVPFSLKFYFGDNFNINAGVFGAGLLGGKTRFTLNDKNGNEVESRDYSLTGESAEDANGNDYLNRFDVGLNAGLEFVSDGGVGVGARFSKGLADITNDDHQLGRGYSSTTEVNAYVVFRF